MSDFISAKYDGQPCLLNMDYVMDVFPEGGDYKAYTMDFDRGEYLIDKSEFDKWQKKAELQEDIKALGEDMRKCQESITDKKVLIGFNMAVALCNKHLAESEE